MDEKPIRSNLLELLDGDPEDSTEIHGWIPYDAEEARLVVGDDGLPRRGVDPKTGEPWCDFHLLLRHCDGEVENRHYQDLFRQSRKRRGKRRRGGFRGSSPFEIEDDAPGLDDQRDWWLGFLLDWVGLFDAAVDAEGEPVLERLPNGQQVPKLIEIEYTEERARGLWRRDGDFSTRLVKAAKTLGHFLGPASASPAGRLRSHRRAESGEVDQGAGA